MQMIGSGDPERANQSPVKEPHDPFGPVPVCAA
jgi:hypothetical protein